MAQRPFNLLRAAFLLLATLIIVELLMTVIVAFGCLYLILSGAYALGACQATTQQIREVWAEMLAAILALLLAGRSSPPPSDE